MATENERVPPSTEVSPLDPPSACAQDGPRPKELPKTQVLQRRRGETRRAQAIVPSSTVRPAAGLLLGGRYRIERELGEGGMGVVYLVADEQVPDAQLLDEEFARGTPFSHAWPIIKDVGAALGNAHDHNVIHSDLKPANILLTADISIGRTWAASSRGSSAVRSPKGCSP